jgi:adenylate kinase family enzyme
MERILVAGSTGAGKTTLARTLAERLAIPFHEMDALAFSGPRWQENPRLVQDVALISAGPCWVFDSLGYPEVRDLLWSRADAIVWLDYSRAVVMRRVLRRSAARTLLRRQIFGGNVETLGAWLRADHPAWWAWTQYRTRQAEIAARGASEQFAPLDVIRLRTPRASRDWLGSVRLPGTGDQATGDQATGGQATRDRATRDRATGDRATGDRATGDQ